jgi:hypothetical protein
MRTLGKVHHKIKRDDLRKLLGWKLTYALRTFVNKRPSLYFIASRLFRRNAVPPPNKDTDAVITGIWGCANTFVSAAFEHWNPDARTSHHQHFPGLVIRATQLDIPCLVLIRHPVEALASIMSRGFVTYSHHGLIWGLKEYAEYYETVIEYSEHLVTADFKEVITDFPAVIKRMNDKFGSHFIAPDPNSEEYKNLGESRKWKGEERKFSMEEVKAALYEESLNEFRLRAETAYSRFCKVNNIPVRLEDSSRS